MDTDRTEPKTAAKIPTTRQLLETFQLTLDNIYSSILFTQLWVRLLYDDTVENFTKVLSETKVLRSQNQRILDGQVDILCAVEDGNQVLFDEIQRQGRKTRRSHRREHQFPYGDSWILSAVLIAVAIIIAALLINADRKSSTAPAPKPQVVEVLPQWANGVFATLITEVRDCNSAKVGSAQRRIACSKVDDSWSQYWTLPGRYQLLNGVNIKDVDGSGSH